MTPRNLPQLALYIPLAAAVFSGGAAAAQASDRLPRVIDSAQVQTLANHHPQWAVAGNDAGAVPADCPSSNLTLALARSSQQEQAFEQLLRDQQDPSSPDYHHWLTPDEIGERFGLSDDDIAAITAWLQSQGLQVSWVSPSHLFIGVNGTAANVGRAFGTELHYYNVNGKQLLSVSSDPTIPAALAPAIRSVRGLYAIDERPAPFRHDHGVQPAQSHDSQRRHNISLYCAGRFCNHLRSAGWRYRSRNGNWHRGRGAHRCVRLQRVQKPHRFHIPEPY